MKRLFAKEKTGEETADCVLLLNTAKRLKAFIFLYLFFYIKDYKQHTQKGRKSTLKRVRSHKKEERLV